METSTIQKPLLPGGGPAAGPETRSAVVSFRMRPSVLEQLDRQVRELNYNRSDLIRNTLATGGFVYIAPDVASQIGELRRTVASAGNLLKLAADELRPLAENPLFAAETQQAVLDELEKAKRAREELLKTREAIRNVFHRLFDTLEDLNRGDF